MKILTFGASNSSKSINKQLVTYASSLFKEQINPNCKIDILDLNDFEMPIYSMDREEKNGVPKIAKDFLEKIANADAMIISYAEHNGGYTVAFKNIFDWASRLVGKKVFQGKPMVILSTSPGAGGAANVLKSAIDSAPFFGANVKASLSVPSFNENFDINSQSLVNPDLNKRLIECLRKLDS